MTKSISLDTLWDSATPAELVFNPDKLSHLPEVAKRYLEHAIAPGTKLASNQSHSGYLLSSVAMTFH